MKCTLLAAPTSVWQFPCADDVSSPSNNALLNITTEITRSPQNSNQFRSVQCFSSFWDFPYFQTCQSAVAICQTAIYCTYGSSASFRCHMNPFKAPEFTYHLAFCWLTRCTEISFFPKANIPFIVIQPQALAALLAYCDEPSFLPCLRLTMRCYSFLPRLRTLHQAMLHMVVPSSRVHVADRWAATVRCCERGSTVIAGQISDFLLMKSVT